MDKYDLVSKLDSICQDLSDRDKLELLKIFKSEVNDRIVILTTSNSGDSYNNIFRDKLENAIRTKHPNLDQYSRYNKYQYLRKIIIDRLNLGTGINTKMLTKDEYDKCIVYLKEEGYDISTD